MNNEGWSIVDGLSGMDPYIDSSDYNVLAPTTDPTDPTFDSIGVVSNHCPMSPSVGHQNNGNSFDFTITSLEVETGSEGEAVQNVNMNAESVEENIRATVLHSLVISDSTPTSGIEQTADSIMKESVQHHDIKADSAQEHTAHPVPAHFFRLSKKQFPPHIYDLVHKHMQPLSDPNSLYQCIYAIRENSICRRTFSPKSEVKDHVAEEYFKKNTKFECCCGRLFTKEKFVQQQQHITRSTTRISIQEICTE
ncbi:hypothetical protein M422DRAFT_251484 [Sphaerobolus stellatus SS14]|uniref:Uncharacterized protein n=1 Tax=Sphaerobolus stellatus (strain SS14) TaxID=990650 RepID=A0A0C9W1B8_SPHS4|nr:hypothetical protein M422DRAFT_251484 [Sphaerobolus stellatus SS14]